MPWVNTKGTGDLCSMREYEKKLEEQGLVSQAAA